MSAKTPRRSFAAPLVVTLAFPISAVAAGGCLVKSGSTPPPAGPRTTDHRSGTDAGGEPAGHVNPPRASYPEPGSSTAPSTDPTPGTVQQTTPTQQASLREWHVFQNASDKNCYAVQDADCPKGATCNPPPPDRLERCPTGLQMPQGLTIREDSANSCAIYYPMPDCPSGVSCNPPRPQTISCPK
jgi:hypothetical protein